MLGTARGQVKLRLGYYDLRGFCYTPANGGAKRGAAYIVLRFETLERRLAARARGVLRVVRLYSRATVLLYFPYDSP